MTHPSTALCFNPPVVTDMTTVCPQIPTTTPCLRCATVRSFSKACSLLTLTWLYQKKWQLSQTAEKQIEELKILDGKHLFSHLIMDLVMFSGTWGDI